MAEHTPGPWSQRVTRALSEPENRWPAVIHGANGKYVGSFFIAGGDDEGPANLALILAAPGLLDACRQFERWDTDPHNTEADAAALRQAIHSAIVKATGGSHA